MPLGKRSLETAQNRGTPSPEQTRISLAPTWTWRLIICGALLDVASTLLPWGANQSYLPWSLIVGQGALLPASEFLTVSALSKAAAVVAWAGVVLYEYVERRTVPYGTILASSVLSSLAVALFAITGTPASWGAYLALIGGVLLAVGVLIERLELEVVVDLEEQREPETEDDSSDAP